MTLDADDIALIERMIRNIMAGTQAQPKESDLITVLKTQGIDALKDYCKSNVRRASK